MTSRIYFRYDEKYNLFWEDVNSTYATNNYEKIANELSKKIKERLPNAEIRLVGTNFYVEVKFKDKTDIAYFMILANAGFEI